MKKLQNLGKILNKNEQLNIFGGISADPKCDDSEICFFGCPDPNHSCVQTICTSRIGIKIRIGICQCTSGNA